MSDILAHDDNRKATWFELFFDLVFVVAVASLAAQLSHHYDWQGALQFCFLFLVLWWLWLGHSFHASRFDKDRPDQWAMGFVQMLAVVFIGYGAGDAFGDRSWAFAGGVAVFKAMLMVAYLREIKRPGLARLCTIYGGIYFLQAALWAGSVLVEGAVSIAFWAVALFLDIISPFLVARETHRAPPHPEHLPERFGLFTIILLGETAAAAVHALDHGPELHGDTLIVAIFGAFLGFLYWVGYFQRAKGNAERHVRDAAAGRNLRLWAYGHIPLYLGIASLGAGTVYLAHHTALSGAAPWLYAAGAACAMVGVSLVSLATYRRSAIAIWPYLGIAVLAMALPAVVSTAVGLTIGLTAFAACQIMLSVLLNRHKT